VPALPAGLQPVRCCQPAPSVAADYRQAMPRISAFYGVVIYMYWNERDHPVAHFHAYHWNKHPRPFVWTKSADDILETLANYCQRILDSGH
jgi:hypothetical protein